ncbi:MAG: VOC family protein [Solirubrobacteraceae bacterium]
MHGELSFFELGVGDTDRARTFYGALFDWELEDGSAGTTIKTPNVAGGLHGGDAGASPYVFFEVDDLEAAVARVAELGGEASRIDLSADCDTVARFGRFVLCKDDQGSAFGLHEPPAQPS